MSDVPGSVLLVTPRWARDGGVAAHVKASARLLAAHGLAVTVAAARAEQDAAEPGVRVVLSPRLFDTDASPRERLGAALSPVPDVVHTHHVDDEALVAHLRNSAPVAMSVHGYSACTSGMYYFRPGEECPRGHGPLCAVNLLARGCAHTRHLKKLPAGYRSVTRRLRAFAAADLVISYSSSVDRHLAANHLTRRRIVPLFSTVEPVVGSGHATRRRVVFAGRVAAPKGIGVLIRAARDVEAEFVICGDGWRSQAMRSLAERVGVADRVSFRGWLSERDLAHELADASVVALPSLWPEPFGLVGIEALAAGRPVVASATGGVSDWLQDGVGGRLVPPGDPRALAGALSELLADPLRQEEMGRAGRAYVAEHFSAQRHLEVLLGGYRTLLGSPSARASLAG